VVFAGKNKFRGSAVFAEAQVRGSDAILLYYCYCGCRMRFVLFENSAESASAVVSGGLWVIAAVTERE